MQPHSPAQGDAEHNGKGDSDGLMAPVEIRVPLDLAAAGSVRHAIAPLLHGHLAAPVLADVQLIVSELVTNSVRHAVVRRRATVRVAVVLADGILRLEVEDPGTAGAVAPRAPSIGGGGFGLHLVEQLAHRWGVERGERTRVWVELVASPAVGAPARPG